MGCVFNATHRPLYPRGKRPGTHFIRPGTHFIRGWLGPQPVWSDAKNLARTFRFVMGRFIYLFIFNYALQTFMAYCAIWVRHSNFRHQASPRVSPCESTQRRKVELWVRNVREFCLNADFRITFRDLLDTVKLRHETDGFTSPLKEGVLRIFSP
jgi:hypothetical protein